MALARALAPEPRLVLLDESFSAPDAGSRAGTRTAVADVLAAAGAAALLVARDQSEALSMGRQVGVLRGGRLVQVASPSELYRHPKDAELACSVGEAALLDGLADAGTVSGAPGRLERSPPVADGPVRAMCARSRSPCAPPGLAPARRGWS